MIKIIICSQCCQLSCGNMRIYYLHSIFVLSSIVEVRYTKYVDALELDDGDCTSQWKRSTQL